MLTGRGFKLPGLQTCSLSNDLYLVELRKQKKKRKRKEGINLYISVSLYVYVCIYIYISYMSWKENTGGNKIQEKEAQRTLAGKPLSYSKTTMRYLQIRWKPYSDTESGDYLGSGNSTFCTYIGGNWGCYPAWKWAKVPGLNLQTVLI